MDSLDPTRTALIVIDLQKALDLWEETGKRSSHPGAVARIAQLLKALKRSDSQVFHVRQQGAAPQPPLRSDGPR